jgi:aspartate/glutamate racemase
VTIGFLHTAEVHKSTFTGLLDEISPGRPSTHIVDPALLIDAWERGGVDDELTERLTARLREAARGAAVVVCTCSTISGPAELLSSAVGVPIIRVDRPMAELAVKSGSRIAVVAVLQSTIAPTMALLTEVARHKGRTPVFDEVVLPDAWSLFEDGHLAAYATAIAVAVDSLDTGIDVVVLAQASMAVAVPHCTTTAPVLSSPRSAVEAAVALAGQ